MSMPTTMNEQDFHIVCIGASAGGLEALERFFKACPPDMGVAYVVIQHLSSSYKSMMDDLMNRYTSIPIHMIEDGMHIKPDNIYLIPAGTTIKLKEHKFVVTRKQTQALTLPIDIFLHSLADDVQEKSIAIVLSGTGSDGSRGAISINAAGGFVIAQTPEDAKFDGMPHSLISTGIVDDVLPVKEIPKRIAKYLNNPVSGISNDIQSTAVSYEEQGKNIESILGYLRSECDIDFNEYKPATVVRRIERRMQVKHTGSFGTYLNLLQSDDQESRALRRELLIPVTSFFRDEEVFDLLRKQTIPDLVKNANPNEGLRIWIAGCSTGEEAYSIAMLVLWECLTLKKWLPVKIFATDVNPEAVDFASAGCFPETIAAEIPSDFLGRFFKHDEGEYIVSNELRQTIVFAKHNLLLDAPFTKMDLVSCRNTLIYFKSKAQTQVLQKLQYATKVGGYLMLGKSESLSYGEHNFETLDGRLKLYRCSQRNAATYVASGGMVKMDSADRKSRNADNKKQKLYSVIGSGEDILRHTYLPPSLLVTEKGEVVHIYREPTEYIRMREGTVNYSLNQILPEKLIPIVSALMFRVKKERTQSTSDKLIFESPVSNLKHNIKVHGYPVLEGEVCTHVLLVIEKLDDIDVDTDGGNELNYEAINSQRVEQLEQELEATRESLQSTIEELETTNEELQATNEELMASNEELQSSNEELQSVNEELNTVNAEYHEKMNILNRINSDLDAMSRAAGIATIFLDEHLNLTRFTPDALEVFKLRDTDIGRPLEEVVHNLEYDNLFQDINLTLKSERMRESQVESNDGRNFLVRMVNYNLASRGDKGVVISFIDITAIKTSEQLQLVMDALPEHIAVLDGTGTILKVNKAWDQFARANGDKSLSKTSIGTNYLEVCDTEDADETANQARKGVKAVLEGSVPRFALEYPCHSPTEERWFAMEVIAVQHESFAAVVSHFNISSWRLKMETLNETE